MRATYRPLAVLSSAVLALFVCACGSGGGGGGGGSTPAPGTGGQGVLLGTRDVPGYRVSVSTLGAVTAGSSTEVRIRAEAEAGASPVTTVEVRAGDEYRGDAAMIAAAPVAGATGEWSASVPIPAEATPGRCAWVRLTLSDGSVLEVGKDFPL